MKRSAIGLALLSVVTLTSLPLVAQAQRNPRPSPVRRVLSGTVQQVWDDGFRLQTARNRRFIVDAYDICGDNVNRLLSVGEQVTVIGEFEGGKLDAFSIINVDGTRVCS